MERADVIVIGGGIIGISASYFLSQQGVDVILLERSSIGSEASGATAGSMGIQSQEIKLIPLVKESFRIWAELQRELEEDLEYRQTGGLRIAETAEELDLLKGYVDKQKKNGMSVDIFSSQELKSFASYLGPSVVAASFCKEDSRGNPLIATPILGRAAQAQGAKIHLHKEVKGITAHSNHMFSILTTQGEYESSSILNCAGVWSRDIFKMVDVDIPITLAPMQCMITEQAPRIIPHMIMSVKRNLTVKQLDHGSILIGGGWKAIGDRKSFTKRVSYESLKGNAQVACRTIPALQDFNIVRCWAGLEGRSPDLLPLMGNVKSLPGFYSATCVRGGFTMGPAIGKIISEIIVQGKTTFPVKAFDINRVIR
jgi:sarcosine oxidase subunit beta